MAELTERVHQVLTVLGDGGTTDMAQRVVTWLAADPSALGVATRNIAGLSEVATVLAKPKATVSAWRKGDYSFPEPFLVLACGPLWDLEQVRRWKDGNPDLVGEAT